MAEIITTDENPDRSISVPNISRFPKTYHAPKTAINAINERILVTRKVARNLSPNGAAVYLYQVDNDGEWGELRFDFEKGTAEIVKLADWDTVKSNVFAKTAIRHVQSLPEVKLPSEAVVMFDQAL